MIFCTGMRVSGSRPAREKFIFIPVTRRVMDILDSSESMSKNRKYERRYLGNYKRWGSHI